MLSFFGVGSDKWAKNHAAKGVGHRPPYTPTFFRREKVYTEVRLEMRVLFYVPGPFWTGERHLFCGTALCSGCHVCVYTPHGFLLGVYIYIAPSDGLRSTLHKGAAYDTRYMYLKEKLL